VGDTWIVDLRHYLTAAGAMAELSPRGRILAEYFASIVVDATATSTIHRPFVVAAVPGIGLAPGS